MTDRALSEAAMLASLHDIHLPAHAAGGSPADIAAVVGLAALGALLLVTGLRVLSRRRPAQAAAPDPLAGLGDLSGDARRVALLHLLRDRAPARYAAIRGEIYAPGGGVDLATLEAEVQRGV